MTDACVLPVCSACQQTPKRGLAGGMWVKGLFICTDCMEMVPEWSAEDAQYQSLKKSIAYLWANHPAWRRHLASAGNP